MSLLNSILDLLRFKRNWKAVLLCILTATVFWFFNALNKTYTSNINFPLEFDYDAQYYIPVEPLPRQVRINVTGNGWDLFRRSLGLKVPPLVIPLERPSDVKKIVGSTLPALFSNQLNTLQINFVVTDTVYLDVEPRVKRWLSLRVDSVGQYIGSDYGLVGNVIIRPDSVFIEGPFSIITSFPEPYSVSLNDNNIDEDFTATVDVPFPEEYQSLVTCTPSEVIVSFQVDPMIIITDKVHLKLTNIPPTADPQIGSDEISITYRIPEGYSKQPSEDSITAILDLKDLQRGRFKLVPEVSGLPTAAEIISLDTINIIY